AVLAPIPKASERTATATKTGDFLNVRAAYCRSWAMLAIVWNTVRFLKRYSEVAVRSFRSRFVTNCYTCGYTQFWIAGFYCPCYSHLVTARQVESRPEEFVVSHPVRI